MNCTEVHNLLSEYLDGEIQGAARETVETHLAQCESCAQALAVLQSTSRLLSEAQELEPPMGLLEQIEAATINHPSLGQRARTALGQLTRVPAYARWATASAMAAAALVLVVMSNPGLHQAKNTPVSSPKPSNVMAVKPSVPTQAAVSAVPRPVHVAVAEVKPVAPKPVVAVHRRAVRIATASSIHRLQGKRTAQPAPKVAQIPNTDVDAAKHAEPIPTAPTEGTAVATTPPATETPQEVQIVRVANVPQPDWEKREADSLAQLRTQLAAKNKQRRYEAHSEPLQGRKVSINLASIRF